MNTGTQFIQLEQFIHEAFLSGVLTREMQNIQWGYLWQPVFIVHSVHKLMYGKHWVLNPGPQPPSLLLFTFCKQTYFFMIPLSILILQFKTV